MEIKSVVLQTNHLVEMKKFYLETLGFPLIHEDEIGFRFKAGTSEMAFTTKGAKAEPSYHFAFDIPANKFKEAKLWAKERLNLNIEDGNDEVYFENLHAHSFYFHDPAGNIVEFISRPLITRASSEPFSIQSILYISEMSLIVNDPIISGRQLNEIGLFERDNKQIHEQGLNFIGEKAKGIFLLLASPGRKWLFSERYSEVFPLEINLSNNYKIVVDPDNELQIYSNRKSNQDFIPLL